MKRFILILLFFPSILSANDWRFVHYSYNSHYIESLSYYNYGLCFAASSNYGVQLLKSTDYGNTWKMTFEVNPDSINDIFNINECFAVTDKIVYLTAADWSILMKSTDGGVTFNKIIFDKSAWGPDWGLWSLSMYDTNKGIVCNDYAYFTTTDGWKTFKEHKNKYNSQTYYSPCFIDSNTIYFSYCGWENEFGFAFVKYIF